MFRGRFRPALTGITVLALLVPPPHPDPGDPPRTEVRTLDLGRAPAAATPGGRAALAAPSWLTLADTAAGDAVLIGAEVEHPDHAVEFRVRRAGAWTPWEAFAFVDDHGPDPGTREDQRSRPNVSDPVWIGPSERLQVRARPGAGEVGLLVVDSIGGDGLGWMPPESRVSPGPAAYAAAAKPPILSRASWGADESLRKYVPWYSSRVRFAIVHHTAGGSNANSYTREEADDVVRAIYAFHTESRGWDDIAYNFVVDRYGTVYEGRSGGITEAVGGSHAAGFNGGSTGIALLGDFDVAQPPTEALLALEQLLAWKLDLHHVDPLGETTEVAGSGSSTRADEHEHVTLPTVFGHRTTNTTSCPGDNLVSQLDGIRDHVSQIGLPKAYGGPTRYRHQPQAGIRPTWDVSFTEPLEWQLRITDEDGNLVRGTGGSGATQVARGWDLRDADGELVAPGEYRATLEAWQASDPEVVITPVDTAFFVTAPADRVAGQDRIATAVEVSRWGFSSARRAVLASSVSYADALVATPLAGSLSAPVLLVPPDGIPQLVLDELERLHTEKVYIVGGTARIPAGVEPQLEELGFEVVRHAGANRYETAAKVADVVRTRESSTEVLVALGDHPIEGRAFPDALSAGSFGAHLGLPVVLTESGSLPEPSRAFLAKRTWKDGATIFGGTGAVSAEVEAQIAAAARAATTRIAGSDRFDTSARTADELLQRWADLEAERGADPNAEPIGWQVVLASGRNWPDALGAGAAANRRGAIFLLVDDQRLEVSAAVRDWLRRHDGDVARAIVSGGAFAVSESVLDDVRAIVNGSGPHRGPAEPWPPNPHADPTPVDSASPLPPVPTPTVPPPEPTPAVSASP